MKVILLAAGRSKRIYPIADKNFLNFLGKPLIKHQLDCLRENGFSDVVVVAGAHNMDEIKKLDPNITVVEQEDLDAGMCGAVLSAKKEIQNSPVFIVSGNDMFEGFAYSLIKSAIEHDCADAYVLAKKVSEYFPGGYLEVDQQNYIKNIVEKPPIGSEPSDLINLVAHFFKNGSRFIEYLENAESKVDDLYETALNNMIRNNEKIKSVPYEGYWQAVKYPWHIQKVFDFLFSFSEKRISPLAKISKNAVINGDVIIEDNVKILDGAVIQGPAYIGENSIIATNALVRGSHIGKNCVIGFCTEVARSYLGEDVWTHSNYIGDSIIGNNVSFGAGAVTGNLRLDEDNVKVNVNGSSLDSGEKKIGIITGDHVRVGVNTSFMPGVKIGSNCVIGPGLVLGEDAPDNSFIKVKSQLEIRENKFNIKDIKRSL